MDRHTMRLLLALFLAMLIDSCSEPKADSGSGCGRKCAEGYHVDGDFCRPDNDMQSAGQGGM